MARIERSFRVFGHFSIGRTDDPDAAKDIPGDCLEIFHVPVEKASGTITHYSLARVSRVGDAGKLPRRITATAVEKVPPERNVFLKDGRAEIETLLEKPGTVSFWIHEPKEGGSGGQRLYFFGPLWLDQFQAGKSEVPSERFPLLPEIRTAKKDSASSVCFGSGSAWDIRIALLFPMPVALGNLFPVSPDKGGVLGFTTLVLTEQEKDLEDDPRALLRPNVFIFAPPGLGKESDVKRNVDWTYGEFAIGTPKSGIKALRGKKAYSSPAFESVLQSLGFGAQSVEKGTGHTVEFLSAGSKDGHVYAVCCRRTQTLQADAGVAVESNKALLDLNRQLGGRLELKDQKLVAECHWTVLMTDNLLFRALTASGEAAHAGGFFVSLRFDTEVPGGIVGAKGAALREPLTLAGAGLVEAARIGNAARAGLVATDRQPQSGLPELRTETDAAVTLPVIGYPSNPRMTFVPGRLPELTLSKGLAQIGFTPDTALLDAGQGPGRNLARRHLERIPGAKDWSAPEAAALSWRLPPDPAPTVPFRMRLPAFDDRQAGADRGAMHYHVLLGYDPEVAIDMGKAKDVISFALGNGAGEDVGLEARLGSLEFVRRGALLQPGTRLRLFRRHRPEVDARPAAGTAATLRLEWQLALSVDRAYPVTTDISHGDREERPSDLLIREAQGGSPDAAFVLTLTERLTDSMDRHLVAALDERSDANADAARDTFTVLTESPFSVYRFSRRPLSVSGGLISVAAYDSDAREWTFRKPEQTEPYRFTRPAGAIGEDADKPRRLELHDARSRADAVAPALADGPDGAARRYAVDTRFSPPTDLWINPSDLQRNFNLPEYAARELFQQRGDFGLGVGFTALRGELLYGLSHSIQPPKGLDAGPGPRVAELETLTGAMVHYDKKEKRDVPIRSRWVTLREALRQRPERLEIWTLDTRRNDPFVPARFDSGVQAAMRGTALLAPPMLGGDQEGGGPPEGLEAPRLHPHGLSGGVLWPLESANITRVLRQAPVATSAEVNGLVLSPMGNSGNQTARFLNNYATIITETRDGFLQKQRVEIIGRIAGLWHPSKHVVIYERTTAPSPQFAPHPDQPTRTRRPALRKVEEFVEILQPVRRFPDMDNVSLRSRGCLEEVRFNSTVIHVNGAWGRDVGRYGWEVPLWNRGEAELRPQIYPYPDVAVVTTGEGSGDRPQAVQECLDVANLYFYTDPEAAKTEVRTDRWPVRHGVDTSALGKADVLGELIGVGKAPKEKPERRTAAGRVLPGLRRFTLRLAPSDVKSRINAERGDKPIFSGLASITLMRNPGDLAKDAEIDDNLKKIKKAVGALGAADALKDLVKPGVALPLGKDNPIDVPAYGTALDAIQAIKDLENPAKANLEKLKADLLPLTEKAIVAAIDMKLAKKGTVLGDAVDLLKNNEDLKEVFERARDFDVADCNALADKAAGAIRRRRLMYVALVNEARKDFARQVMAANVLTRETARDWLIEAITAESDAFFEETARNLGELRSGVATVRAITADWRADVHVAMDNARARLDAFARSYDRNKPWSRNRIDAAFAALSAELENLEKEAEQALDELRSRAATEIGVSANAVGARVAKAIRQAMGLGAQAFHTFDSVEASVTKGVERAKDAIAKVPTQADIDERLKQAERKVDDINDAEHMAKAQVALKKVRDAATALKIDDVKARATALVDQSGTAAKQGIGEIRELNREVLALTVRVLEDLGTFSEEAHEAVADLNDAVFAEVVTQLSGIGDLAQAVLDATKAELHRFLKTWENELAAVDEAVADARGWIEANTRLADRAAEVGLGAAEAWLTDFEARIASAAQVVNTRVRDEFSRQVVLPLVDGLFETVPWPPADKVEEARALALELSEQFPEQVSDRLDELASLPLSGIEEAKAACVSLVGVKAQLLEEVDKVAEAAAAELKAALDAFGGKLDEAIADITKWNGYREDVLNGAEKLLGTVNEIGNQIADAGDNVRAYLDRGLDILARAGDARPGAMPGVALQFISAATQAPEIAALKVNAERIRVLMDEAKDVLETPAIRAGLDRLGDALKALGLEFDFKTFGDRFVPEFGEDQLLNRLLPDLGGINLRDMLPSAKLPEGLRQVVRLSHDLDAKAGRAWVQADLDVPLPGRQPMFSIGPFTLFLRDSRLTAFLRADASKDSEEVAVTDRALMLTTIEAVVGGQVMVTLQDVMITYSSEDKLNFTLDPTKIRIHQTMRFIQDTLGSIFGDELGGLVFIKENGIPVGVEHKFAMPPLSLMYGTSGVSNLQISNRFALRAYPDFIIANRFNLSRRELPFLFTIFIIGGAGYIQVDTEYRPFDKQLMVVVEAGLGGSAALGFSLGPVSGGVFISISVVLRYQKTIGSAPNGEDGLSVSLVLLIAGSVTLWGMVTVYLGLMLSISYHDSGKIDGLGQLSVEVRISRWFKLRFSSQVKYRLRDGQTTTQVESKTETGGKYLDAMKKFEALKKTRAAL